MDQDRWRSINRIFHAALEVEPGQRSALVASASGDDIELKAEVERLLQADEDVGSYLESPLLLTGLFAGLRPPLSPGDVLCGRFRIVREIAEGGMGHVFEAFDTELAVHVALKVIRPEIAANPEALARFRQEVRLARTITHTNICRTFDMERAVLTTGGNSTELVFLTMEFLPGETLARRLQQGGPIPPTSALAIARQIAAALHAAHALGIVHRDMKPANIMLVPSETSAPDVPRVVVTDFGLARRDSLLLSDPASSFTNPSHPVGTLSYMAPEQLEGAAVSPATDIYAFGLILFEMLTGQRAFPSDNLLSGITQRLRGTVSLDQRLGPQTPANWRETIKACLEVDPSDRPQDADHVLAMLEERPGGLFATLRATIQRSIRRLRRLSFRAGIAWATITLGLVSLFAVGLRLYQSRAASQVAPGALVYLTQVQNQTGERSFDGLTELIRASLSQSTQINILDQGRVGDTLQHMTRPPEATIDPATAREVAMRTGAVRVIFLNLTSRAGTCHLDIDIQQPDNTPTRYRSHWSQSFTWRDAGSPSTSRNIPAAVLSNVRSATDWIRHEVGESANDIAHLDTPPENVTTDNWQALYDYAQATRLQTPGQRPQAVALLRDALDQDPRFALAYALLGDTLYSMDRSSEGNLAYRSALQLVGQNRLSLRERDRIKGLIAHDTHDYQAAAEAYREYTLYYPNDFIGWFRLARPLALLGRTQESIDALIAAHNVDPSKSSAPTQIVRGYQLLHDPQATHQWLQTMQRSYPANDYHFALAPNQFLEGDYAAAEQTMRSLSASSTPLFRDVGYLLLADLYAERGDDQQMLATLNKALDKQQNGRTQLFYRAELLCKLHNISACIDDLDRAIALQPGPDSILTAGGVLGRAIATASPNEKKTILTYLVSLEAKQPTESVGLITDLSRHVLRGEVLLAQAHTDAAIAEFRKAAVLDAPLNPKEYLARALAASAIAHHGQPQAESAAREAMALYATTANNPEKIWWFAPGYPPGSYANSVVALLKLHSLYPGLSSNHTALTKTFSNLRPAVAAASTQP